MRFIEIILIVTIFSFSLNIVCRKDILIIEWNIDKFFVNFRIVVINVQHDENKKWKNELSSEQLLQVIFDYAAKIANEKNLDQLLIYMADMGRKLVVSDRCTVWLLDEERQELWTKVAHNLDYTRVSVKKGLVGYAVRTGEPIIIEDAYKDDRFNREVDLKTGYRTKAMLVIPFKNNEGQILGAYQAINKMTKEEVFSKTDLNNLTLAASYTGKSLESALLYNEIEETQKEIIFTMGEIGEIRSKETGNHVRRVAEYSYLLAKLYGLSDDEAELIKIASPMHDIGKVAIPDAILNKPGKLTDEEYEHMKSHTVIGYNLLKHSKRKILQSAAIIAHEHHEKWNGTGYPNGLKGENIHLYGRITAIADVFDALASDRVYKKGWELPRIIELFQKEKGEHFDPKLTELFLQNIDQFVAIKEKYEDV